MKLEFPRQILSNFMKIRPVGTELFYADGRTDGRVEAVLVCSRTAKSGGLLRIHKADVFWSKRTTVNM